MSRLQNSTTAVNRDGVRQLLICKRTEDFIRSYRIYALLLQAFSTTITNSGNKNEVRKHFTPLYSLSKHPPAFPPPGSSPIGSVPSVLSQFATSPLRVKG